MTTMFADTILIVFISICTALLAEGITWVLVYRTDKYKRLKAEVEKQSKKLEKKKETITESAGRQQKKKIERQEEKLKNNNRDLSMVRMKSMFAIGFCFTALMGMFNAMVCLIAIFWVKIAQIVPSFFSIFSAPCLFGRIFRSCWVWLLPELPPSRLEDSSVPHLKLGSSPEIRKKISFAN
ncbi:calcium load-activated calcium channel isoform X2 [Erythrolamprus reginae]|uniref:calcium load-activated calcium channel isoform X2 n=1 Tax=Erythrolamprus reginae TaxID=121349 RepID=UPI00396C95EE